ncbi:MAG TPA: hypothetical protein VJW55_07285, partial [Candidatus Angelobacter sp.]|nr:hypothetical protein [Candidatus Angelobacter sp.]
HVTFRVDNDLSVQGLMVVSPGTKIDATVRKVQRPRNWVRDAGLGFSLDTLRLVDGQTVALKPGKIHGNSIWTEDEVSFWMVALAPITVPWMATHKGDETSQGPGMCLPAETAQDITLDKNQVESLQPQGSIAGEANWKTRLQQMLPHPLALNTLSPELEQGEEIEELDLASGQERRLDKCKRCASPVTYPSGLHTTVDVYFLDSGKLYATAYDTQPPYARHGKWGVLDGKFSRILAIMGTEGKSAAFADFALLQWSGKQCNVLRVSQVLSLPQIVDSTDCSEISKGGLQPGEFALRPAQILGDRYVTDVASPNGMRALAIGSLTAPGSLKQVGNLDASYSRFDPVWRDATHIVYMRKP